ncbi:MAG: hypothetical protein Hyperionvirus5_23 [Hyperionvirus sp.]|uniref:BTB domain-containing protein n=1 Tax=Hyperionvirus sp. TaxID=2487770 RepID=A0A3G5A7J5_9VIRU|nr:MAG: hypothetical protein Hyperionvirus5_23 [Hyperionvirus sp.]
MAASLTNDEVITDNNQILLLLLSQKKGDITVLTKDSHLKIFSEIIAFKSPFFKKMFQSIFLEAQEKIINLQSYSYEAVYEFFANVYFFTGCQYQEHLTLEQKLEVLSLFHSYQFEKYYNFLEAHIMEIYTKGTEIISLLDTIKYFPIITDKIKLHCIDLIKKMILQRIHLTKPYCYDSLKPGTADRDSKDIYPYCCKHFGTKETSHLSKIYVKRNAIRTILGETGKFIGKPTCIYKTMHPSMVPDTFESTFRVFCCTHGPLSETSSTDVSNIFEAIPNDLKETLLKEILTLEFRLDCH